MKQVVFANENLIVECEYSFDNGKVSFNFNSYELRTAESLEDEKESYCSTYLSELDNEEINELCRYFNDCDPSELQEKYVRSKKSFYDLYDSDILTYESSNNGFICWYHWFCSIQYDYTMHYIDYGINITEAQKKLDDRMKSFRCNFWDENKDKDQAKLRIELESIMKGFKELYPLSPIQTAEKKLKSIVAKIDKYTIDQ